MPVTATDLVRIAPEFSTEQTSRISSFIHDAEFFVNETVWGAKRDLGVVYMTAHLLKISQMAAGGASGQVISEKVGDLQRTYASGLSNNGHEDLAATAYGRRFQAMQRTLVKTPVVIS